MKPNKMTKKTLLIVLDPLPVGYSVQFKFLISLVNHFLPTYDITLYSNFIAEEKSVILSQMGAKVLKKESPLILGFIKGIFFTKLNESLLWGVNWFFDLLALKVRKKDEVENIEGFDITLNISSTIICESSILWVQGPPFFEVVESMVSTNLLARIFLKIFHGPLKNASKQIVNALAIHSKTIVANSKYIFQKYSSLNLKVDAVVYNSTNNFEGFTPAMNNYLVKYVLTYIGKETDIEVLNSMARDNINVIGFGSKLPPGVNVAMLRKNIKYLGSVSEIELVKLYRNALFVAFPFTSEPFGLIPIESMLCGTPVLTYNKEGPSETVINGETGWLVNSREEFLTKAKEIWENGKTGISKDVCVNRGREFTFDSKIVYLDKIIAEEDKIAIYSNS